MKVLVSFKVNHKFDNFEGARVRKSIKGALEMAEQPYTTSLVDYYDCAHLIFPESETKVNSIQEGGAPVIISALYAEDDPTASYLLRKKKSKDNKEFSIIYILYNSFSKLKVVSESIS